MTRKETTDPGPEERLAEVVAQVEGLQSAAAEAGARAESAEAELSAARGQISVLEGEVSDVRTRLTAATLKYREAKLAAAPDVLPELVPEAETLEEIDRGFEAAQRVATRLRQRIEEERQSARVPAGAPVRRGADLSVLSPSEKIKLGLLELGRR